MKAEGQEFKATLSCVRVCSQPGLLLSDSYLKKKKKKGKGNKAGSRERGKERGGERKGRREGNESLGMLRIYPTLK